MPRADKELGSAPKARGEEQCQEFGNPISLLAEKEQHPWEVKPRSACQPPRAARPRQGPGMRAPQPGAQPPQRRPTSLQLQECLGPSTQIFLIAGSLAQSVPAGWFFKVSFFVYFFLCVCLRVLCFCGGGRGAVIRQAAAHSLAYS